LKQPILPTNHSTKYRMEKLTVKPAAADPA